MYNTAPNICYFYAINSVAVCICIFLFWYLYSCLLRLLQKIELKQNCDVLNEKLNDQNLLEVYSKYDGCILVGSKNKTYRKAIVCKLAFLLELE